MTNIFKFLAPKAPNADVIAAQDLVDAKIDLLKAEKELEYWAGWVPTLRKRIARLTTHTLESVDEPVKVFKMEENSEYVSPARMEAIKHAAYLRGMAWDAHEIGPSDLIDNLKLSPTMHDMVLEELSR